MQSPKILFSFIPVSSFVVLVFALAPAASAQTPKGKDAPKNVLTIVDHSGKKHTLTQWRFVGGVRRLTWLATADEKTTAKKSKLPAGLEVLEFSEGKSPPLKVRVLTLIPVESLRSLVYDDKKNLVAAAIASNDKDIVLNGLTGYVNVNMLAIEAEADLGDLGRAHFKFRGGVNRGIRSLHFSAPKPIAELPKGRSAKILDTTKSKMPHKAIDLQIMYGRRDGTSHIAPHLYFQKTVQADLGKIQKLSQVGSKSASRRGLVFDVTLKSGLQKPLVLIESRIDAKKRPEFLHGLIGRVDAGYKLFPMLTINELAFDSNE